MKKSTICMSFLGLFASLVLTGCGAKGKQFTEFEKPSEGKGMVYVYRPSSFVGSGVYYDVKNDENTLVGTLRNGGFIFKEMEPGERTLSAKTEATETVQVVVKQNEIVCIRGGVRMGVLVGRPDLNTVSFNQCESEIKDTKASAE